MNNVSSFHRPLPGDTAVYYCWNCKKNFSAKVPNVKLLFTFSSSRHTVKCPDCKKKCSLSPMVQY